VAKIYEKGLFMALICIKCQASTVTENGKTFLRYRMFGALV